MPVNIRAHFIAICLAVVLVLTGQSMAGARGAAGATGKMVLCVGTQSVVVYMDEQRQPTQAPHFCPDCTLTLIDAAPTGTAVSPAVLVLSPHITMACVAAHSNVDEHSYLSRAPPAVV
ncbi:MAG: hypothetical protein P8N75_05740 [Ascidiaceihabitans sp.]|jgi:hypothetical protein|nr:hypothetical protein [Ascidiaceihabitans sp.]